MRWVIKMKTVYQLIIKLAWVLAFSHTNKNSSDVFLAPPQESRGMAEKIFLRVVRFYKGMESQWCASNANSCRRWEQGKRSWILVLRSIISGVWLDLLISGQFSQSVCFTNRVRAETSKIVLNKIFCLEWFARTNRVFSFGWIWASNPGLSQAGQVPLSQVSLAPSWILDFL